MAPPFNPMGKMQKTTPPATQAEAGSVVDPLAPEEDQTPELQAAEAEMEPATPSPKMLTPEQLRQDPDELLSEENEDGTEQSAGSGGQQDRG